MHVVQSVYKYNIFRENEAPGGIFATGIITKTYRQVTTYTYNLKYCFKRTLKCFMLVKFPYDTVHCTVHTVETQL